MNYSEAFKFRVKLIYPNNTALIKALETGSPFVGKMLEQYSQESISNNEILDATDLQELKAKAQVIKLKRELYKMWLSIDIKERSEANLEKLSNV